MDDLPVTIIALRELQRIKGGDPAAWLQVLEPEAERRPAIWANILEQDLAGRDRLKSVMMKIDEEAYMTVAEEFRVEGQNKMQRSIAQNLMEQGVDDSVIVKATGLSQAQLDQIRAQNR